MDEESSNSGIMQNSYKTLVNKVKIKTLITKAANYLN
jgi:hypothetical protein